MRASTNLQEFLVIFKMSVKDEKKGGRIIEFLKIKKELKVS